MTPDVSIVLEGTWPLRTGGVSRWLDGLIRGLPELTFAVTHLHVGGPTRPILAVPDNVTDVRFIDVSGPGPLPERALAEQVPDGRLLYALSSGEAGWIATAAASIHRRPLALTEHGLAWREAAAGCGQLESGRDLDGRDPTEWVDVLLRSARATYSASALISTVSAENVRLQLEVGAPRERLRVIENWVDRAEPVPVRSRANGVHVGMVCRVVPGKDVVGFVEAARIVADTDPTTRFSVIGPLDHDRAYARDVADRIAQLGLSDVVSLVGECDPSQWWPTLDIVALSSVSEAQPLALLEAMAHGLPVVCTDVGGCRNLVGGHPPAGEVVPARDPAALASAMLRLAGSPTLRRELGRNGLSIARSWHDRERVLDEYRRFFERARATG